MEETRKTTAEAKKTALKETAKDTVKKAAEAAAPAAKAVKEAAAPAAKAVKEAAAPAAKAVKEAAAPAAKAVKKEAEKAKTAVKKAAPKKAAVKKEIETTVSVQFSGKSYTTKELVEIAKDVWKYDLKQKVSDFRSVELYVKPEENQAYYVINGEYTGSFFI